MPGTDRVALPLTVCVHDTVPAMLRATAHPTSRILADAGMTETNRFAASSNTVGRVSVFAAATGIGSWPGSSPREAAEVVVGELHTLTHLVELPARGVGADMIGRAGALLVDIGIDTVPRGYRIASGRGAVTRRATSLLGEDVDALEEAWEKAGLRGSTRTVKVQAPGPITLAAQLELPGGHRAITDPGALRDLAGSLAEGVAAHRAELARRLETSVVVQFDEPLLPAALAGRLTGVTSFSPVHPVDEAVATALFDQCVATVGGEVVLHSCASDLPWKALQRSTLHAISVDVSTLAVSDLDGIGEFVDSGRTAMLGVVPALAPDRRPSVKEIAQSVAAITDRLGFPRSLLRERVGITPACGLAGATPEWARVAIELAQKATDAFAEDPDAI
jgi:methionine synthase II (cobalamin-independent)